MNARQTRLLAGGLLMVAATAAFALAPATFSLDWFTIDGGGTMRSGGGHFELSATTGQADASGPLSGNGFELTGGFWFALAPDDCNSDGGVNLYDYEDFESCLAGPGGDPGTSSCSCFDQDGDRDVDLLDFAEFQGFFQTP